MTKSNKINLVRLRRRNQITLPAAIVDSLGLEEGDYLATVLAEEGVVRLRPAKLVTGGTPEAERAIRRAEADVAAGRTEQYDSVREFTADMLANHQEQMKDIEAGQTTMLVHVGTDSTSASIQRDGIPIFTRTIGLGSRTGTGSQLTDEVRKTIEYFQSAGGAGRVGVVFLSVGPPHIHGIANELQGALGIQVRELSPAERAVPGALRGLEPGNFGEINIGELFSDVVPNRK
jgi:AbrB family looped-hinge helix DNA binding protein